MCSSHNADNFLLQSENLPTVRRITPQDSILYNRMKVCIVNLIIKANEMHSFSNLFDTVLYVLDRSTVHHQEYLNTVSWLSASKQPNELA